ncbi:MAG: OmpA family protein [Saprospirales bacterium]|nr:OmpA family protein [Saprospirales bacterium]
MMTAPAWKLLFLVLLLPLYTFGQSPAEGKIRRSDRDGDGLKNKRDHCPDEAGPVYLFGCPDSDGDGVTDSKDLCPLEPGLEFLQGCPDSDADGISDLFDECPHTYGRADRKGCPDQDDDGIVDDLDQCPTEPGTDKTFGCPDADEDGIADREDDCPDLPGDRSARGCPDRDGDGIRDADDKCPNTPGEARLNGCPEILPADLALLDQSTELAFFPEGSTDLTPAGKAYLDQVAEMLQRYPDFHLHLAVHTDTQGKTADNLTLTDYQARTCVAYLVAKGISPTRLQARAFGETMPIANNRYPEGRARNRRVEVVLVIGDW